MGSLGSGVVTCWPAEVLSGAEVLSEAGIEEDRDRGIAMEDQPEPVPNWSDVTTAERSHLVTDTVEASEIAGLVGVEVPKSGVGIAEGDPRGTDTEAGWAGSDIVSKYAKVRGKEMNHTRLHSQINTVC